MDTSLVGIVLNHGRGQMHSTGVGIVSCLLFKEIEIYRSFMQLALVISSKLLITTV